MNHLWMDKAESSIPSSPEPQHATDQFKFVRSSSASTLAVDSRFKGLRYSTPRPSSSTFTSNPHIPITRNSFIYDRRKEIFV